MSPQSIFSVQQFATILCLPDAHKDYVDPRALKITGP